MVNCSFSFQVVTVFSHPHVFYIYVMRQNVQMCIFREWTKACKGGQSELEFAKEEQAL